MWELIPVFARELVSGGLKWLTKPRDAKSLKLEVRSGGHSHWWQLEILNSGKRPVIIHATDWCVGRGRDRRSFDSATWDKKILPNGTLNTDFSPYGVFQENVQRYSRGKDIRTLRFRIHTASGMIQPLHPGRELIDCLTRPCQGSDHDSPAA